jgi:hypothetical protein
MIPIELLRDLFWPLFAVCSRQAKKFIDWYRRPSRCELRGNQLLREWLSPRQLAQYERNALFEVTGSHTGKKYLIRRGTGLNVCELDDAGLPQSGWCFVPGVQLVAGDVMLAQKIALETDERAALAVANRFDVR